MKLKGLSILAIIVTMCALVASAFTPPTPFMIQGYVLYEDGSACNGSIVNITNQNMGKVFTADTNAGSHYYQFMLANGTDVNETETLQFDVKSQDGTQSKVFNHTVNETEINNGGIFNFDISLAASTAIIFDTGPGTYPSIMGTHEGNFTPNCNITVHQVYTYPCAGTGGHTEYARIWNNSGLNVIAKWGGYIGDYHNITFNETFVLYKNKTYNYTIRTGSYPQIIHETPFSATGGTITCDKFIDANGRIYYDWIPAFRLFL